MSAGPMTVRSSGKEHTFDIDLAWPVGITAKAACKHLDISLNDHLQPCFMTEYFDKYSVKHTKPLDPGQNFRSQGVRSNHILVLTIKITGGGF